MSTVIIIPARYASSRYPGKPLAMLHQPTGETMSLIEMSYKTACQVKGVDNVFVATDDLRIKETAEAFGASVIMTSDTCKNGTERCAEALAVAELEANLIINLQGDAPLTPPWFVEELIAALNTDQSAEMATPVLQVDAETYSHFRQDRLNNRVGGTTAIFDRDRYALYFSKEVLPFLDISKLHDPQNIPVYHHVGVYAYRPDALKTYMSLPEGPLEQLEGLEQLRFLENGHKVKCVEVDAKGRIFWELNNPEDVERIENAMRSMA